MARSSPSSRIRASSHLLISRHRFPRRAPAPIRPPFTFEAEIAVSVAKVYVVQCDATHSFGPLVFVPGVSSWKLIAHGRLVDGIPYQGFSGGLSGRSPDEFGIAWLRPDQTHSTVTLYRVASGLQEFWDSSSIGLQWALAEYHYQAALDTEHPAALIVVSADLATGTPNCATCHDHALTREVLTWQTIAGLPRLATATAEPAGIGPP